MIEQEIEAFAEIGCIWAVYLEQAGTTLLLQIVF